MSLIQGTCPLFLFNISFNISPHEIGHSLRMKSRQACNFIKKETLEQVFSCEFCEISKNTFSYRTPLVAASENPYR